MTTKSDKVKAETAKKKAALAVLQSLNGQKLSDVLKDKTKTDILLAFICAWLNITDGSGNISV